MELLEYVAIRLFNALIGFLNYWLCQLVEQDSEGQCNSECKTIERACQEVIFLVIFCFCI